LLLELVNQALWMPHLLQTRVPRAVEAAAAPLPKVVPAPLGESTSPARRSEIERA
jgi:hypothetical protein